MIRVPLICVTNWGIEVFRVELLYDHDRKTHGYLTKRFHPRLWMTSGRVVSAKSDRTTWRSGWTPRLEKFSKKSWWAFPSQNQTWVGVRSEENVPKQRGFQDGVDLHFGVMRSLSEREERRETKNTIITEYQQKKKEGTYA